MDKRKKIILIVGALLVLCIIGMRNCTKEVGQLFTNILPKAGLHYSHPECYTTGSVGSTDQNIRNFQIEWGCGNVDVHYADVQHIVWKETLITGKPVDSNLLHYWVHDNCLDMRFCDSGRTDIRLGKSAELMKDIEVLLPRDIVLNKVEIVTINGNNTVEINANEIEVSTVNGCNTLTVRQTQKVDMHTVNGNIALFLPDTAMFEAEIGKVNGVIYNDFPCVKNGNTYVCGDPYDKHVKLHVVNGIIQIHKIHN
ncbi:MAG: hypothetical protein MJZ64_03280 [Paludibacteraceae bacterium]|nr:hypothetical protein [Paludibacteraceae bacterium]